MCVRARVRHRQPAASHVDLRVHTDCMCFWADVLICMHIKVAMYAIDAMRQLAFKFLEKDELTSFHFQRDFLKPFDHIIAHATSPVIRELVVRCLTQVHDRITSVHARTRTHTGATAPSPHHALALTPAPTCRAQVVRSTARNIKSGWKTIFHVLLVAAREWSGGRVRSAWLAWAEQLYT